MRLAAAALAACAIVTPAEAREEFTLFSSGFWSVRLVDWEDGKMSCKASSVDAEAGTRMAIWGDDWERTLNFQFLDEGWNLPEINGRIFVDIDYHRFEAVGRFSGNSVFVFDLSPEFMRAFEYGSAIALFDTYGERVMTYSLRGTNAATDALLECWNRI